MIESGGIEHVIKTRISEGCKIHLLADLLYHCSILLGIGICVLLENFFRYVTAFKSLNNSSGDKIHLGL